MIFLPRKKKNLSPFLAYVPTGFHARRTLGGGAARNRKIMKLFKTLVPDRLNCPLYPQ